MQTAAVGKTAIVPRFPCFQALSLAIERVKCCAERLPCLKWNMSDIWTFVDALSLRLKDFQLSMCGTRLLFTKSANQNEFVFFPENWVCGIFWFAPALRIWMILVLNWTLDGSTNNLYLTRSSNPKKCPGFTASHRLKVKLLALQKASPMQGNLSQFFGNFRKSFGCSSEAMARCFGGL